MAEILSLSGSIKLVTIPLHLEQDDEDWIKTQFRVSRNGANFLSEELGVMVGDFEELRNLLTVGQPGATVNVVAATDGNLIFEAHYGETGPKDQVAIGLWVGEPYDLMKGARFLTKRTSLEEFVERIQREASAIRSPQPSGNDAS